MTFTPAEIIASMLSSHTDYLQDPDALVCTCGRFRASGAELGALGTAFVYFDHVAEEVIKALDEGSYTITPKEVSHAT